MNIMSAIVLFLSAVSLTAQPPPVPTRVLAIAKPAAVVRPPVTNNYGQWAMRGEIAGICLNASNAAARLGTNGTGIAWFYGTLPGALNSRYLSTNFSNTFDFYADSRLPLYVAAACYTSNQTVICATNHFGTNRCWTNDIVTEPLSPVWAIYNPNMATSILTTNSPLFGADYVLTVWGITNVVYTVEDGPDALGLFEPVTTFDGTNGPWIYVQPEDTNSVYKIFEVTGRQ
jgi:hypothetical protein